MVWKYDPEDVLTDDVFPEHLHLRQTRTTTSIGKSGLFDFVVAEDGETLVWSYTDPQPYGDNEMGYVQSMTGAATSGPIDQRPAVEIWFDFVPEGDWGGKSSVPGNFLQMERGFFTVKSLWVWAGSGRSRWAFIPPCMRSQPSGMPIRNVFLTVRKTIGASVIFLKSTISWWSSRIIPSRSRT